MFKRAIIAIVAGFILISILDYLIHGVILSSAYQTTPDLWRPMGEFKMGLMYVVGFLHMAGFVFIYWYLARTKGLATGLAYGLLYGLTTGLSMGFGTYTHTPITLQIAWVWFLGRSVEMLLVGGLVGAIMGRDGRD